MGFVFYSFCRWFSRLFCWFIINLFREFIRGLVFGLVFNIRVRNGYLRNVKGKRYSRYFYGVGEEKFWFM